MFFPNGCPMDVQLAKSHFQPQASCLLKKIFAGTQWTTYFFETHFAEKPVVVVLPGDSDRPATVRLRSVTSTSFEAMVVVPSGSSGNHPSMTVNYMVSREGYWALPDGRRYEAGVVNTKSVQKGSTCNGKSISTSWQSVNFLRQIYTDQPGFAATIQTCNNEVGDLPSGPSKPFMTVAVKDLATKNVQIALELMQSAGEGDVVQEETVGFIAMEPGSGMFVERTGNPGR